MCIFIWTPGKHEQQTTKILKVLSQCAGAVVAVKGETLSICLDVALKQSLYEHFCPTPQVFSAQLVKNLLHIFRFSVLLCMRNEYANGWSIFLTAMKRHYYKRICPSAQRSVGSLVANQLCFLANWSDLPWVYDRVWAWISCTALHCYLRFLQTTRTKKRRTYVRTHIMSNLKLCEFASKPEQPGLSC